MQENAPRTIKRMIAKEWIIFVLCSLVGLGSYILYDSLYYLSPKNWTVRFFVFISPYLLVLFIRSIIWSAKQLEKKEEQKEKTTSKGQNVG